MTVAVRIIDNEEVYYLCSNVPHSFVRIKLSSALLLGNSVSLNDHKSTQRGRLGA